MMPPMETIRRLVGDISEEPFSFVDYAVNSDVGLFVPVSGQCYYAITPCHTHPSYSFVVSFDDCCQVAVDGRILRSRPGTFCAFSPDVPHQELPMETPARYVAVMIAPDGFHRALDAYGRPGPLPLRGDIFPTRPGLLSSLREFMSEFEEQAPGWETLLEATGARITHLIIREVLGVPRRDEKADFRMGTNRAVEFMHTHLQERMTLTELARISGFSVSQFARVFKQETGIAPIEYLQELRLQRARRLLRDSGESITEIALSCGFNSSSYFSRCYQTRFGTSPSSFRKSMGMRESCKEQAR